MKFFRLDLLTLLISLFILNSCKNQDSIGLGINAPGQIMGTMVDTSTIIVNTLNSAKIDSVVTSGALPKNALGYFNDPIFGVTRASIATDINLPGNAAYTLPSGTITIDSAMLVLPYADGFYGDSTSSSYKVNVYTLNEKFVDGTTYYNTKKWNYNAQNLIGSRTYISPKTHDSIKITNIIAGAPDTLIKVPAQMRIKLSNSYINQILFEASSTALSSNTVFQNNNKGLYITIDSTQSTGQGGIFMIKPADSIVVYYKSVSGITIDTAQVTLPISQLAVQFSHSYTTTIEAELNNTTTSGNTFYLQGPVGLKAKISFPNLLVNLRKNLLKKDSDIVLNRAELVITPSPGTNIPIPGTTKAAYSALPKLTMYKLDIAHQPTILEDANAGDPRSGGIGTFGGFYNPTLNQYHFIITAYLQDLLLGKTVDYGTYIAPVDTTNTSSVDYLPTPQVAARTVAVGTDKSVSRIRLNIIYTKISLK